MRFLQVGPKGADSGCRTRGLASAAGRPLIPVVEVAKYDLPDFISCWG